MKSTLVAFPIDKATPSWRRIRTDEPCGVIVLPVVRIERNPERRRLSCPNCGTSAKGNVCKKCGIVNAC